MATTTKKTTKKVFTNVTLAQAEEAGRIYANNINRLTAIEADINVKITEVRSIYEEEVTTLKKQLEEPVALLEVFAQENKNKWDKKSFSLTHCILSFRTGNRQVDKTSTFTWASIVSILKGFKNLKQFVRTKEEVNKEAILAIEDAKLLKQLNDKCGISIKQEESFTISTKSEEIAA